MGVQTMATQSGGAGGVGGQRTHIQTLARQGSLYSLTLNEVQNHLGEPLLSMNLDDLLRSVFPDGVDPDGAVTSQYMPGMTSGGLQRQGSITMPPELSKKTVDEVWKGMQDGSRKMGIAEEGQRRERQPTLEEMTLEDFLVKAGVVTEGYTNDSGELVGNVDPSGSSVGAAAGAAQSGFATGVQWLQYQQQMLGLEPGQQGLAGAYVTTRPVPQPLVVATGSMLDSVYPNSQITSPMSAMSDPQTPGRKRAVSGEVPDKLIERRQKRMIKNRESAARSRARKQAYTNELENKVSRLEEENERLKKQKKLDTILCSAPISQPKYQLRRINSAPI